MEAVDKRVQASELDPNETDCRRAIAATASRMAKHWASKVGSRFGSEAANAVQHAYWMALVSHWMGGRAALSLGVAHQNDAGYSGGNDSAIDSEKDLLNNTYGANLGGAVNGWWNIDDMIMEGLKTGQLKCLAGGRISTCTVRQA